MVKTVPPLTSHVILPLFCLVQTLSLVGMPVLLKRKVALVAVGVRLGQGRGEQGGERGDGGEGEGLHVCGWWYVMGMYRVKGVRSHVQTHCGVDSRNDCGVQAVKECGSREEKGETGSQAKGASGPCFE
jgi:hypothetical protein